MEENLSFKHSRKYFFNSSGRCQHDNEGPEDYFKVNVFYRTLDVAMAELRVRLEGHNLVASMFSFLYPQKLKASKVQDIENSVGKILIINKILPKIWYQKQDHLSRNSNQRL